MSDRAAVGTTVERPKDEDGFTVRILCTAPDNDRFKEWAEASHMPGDVWQLVNDEGEVVEEYEF